MKWEKEVLKVGMSIDNCSSDMYLRGLFSMLAWFLHGIKQIEYFPLATGWMDWILIDLLNAYTNLIKHWGEHCLQC